jgi:transposase
VNRRLALGLALYSLSALLLAQASINHKTQTARAPRDSVVESRSFVEEPLPARPAQIAFDFCGVPTTLPRGITLGSYSPRVCVQYSGLGLQAYRLKVWLLGGSDIDHPVCASTQWCERTFLIDNTDGQKTNGRIDLAENMDVFDIPLFYWLGRLYQGTTGEVQVAPLIQRTVSEAPLSQRPPVLNPIGNKTVFVGQSLDFTVSASDPDGDAFNFSAVNLPPGATFDGATGQFHWQPAAAGTFELVGFVATQAGGTPLTDAELIAVTASTPPPPGVLAFNTASFKTGEGGPAVLTVTRTGDSAGAVSVTYSTADGTAVSGSDYAGVSNGTLSFADGETVRNIYVSMMNDAAVEANETFVVSLSAPTGGATLGAQSQATVTIVDDDTPTVSSQWGSVQTWPTVPIHVHLLPTGKVMFWDRHNHGANPPWDVTPRLWDPANPAAFTSLPLPGWDIFCSGHTLMADGRMFVAGGQVGHPGATLGFVETPDHLVIHAPQSCYLCGSALGGSEVARAERRQVHDLPPPQVEVTEHRAQTKVCGRCGAENKAEFPAGVRAPVQYGARVRTVAAYLLGYLLLPYERCAEAMRDLFDCHPSPGTLEMDELFTFVGSKKRKPTSSR